MTVRRAYPRMLALPGYLFGLTLSNNAGGTTAIDVALGAAAADSFTDPAIMVLASALTGKVLGTSWSVGSGGGLLASGAAVTNTTYHIFLIMRDDTLVVDVAADTSVTGANIAANTNAHYTYKRRIGSILREGGNIVAFVQDGDTFLRGTPVSDVSATSTGTSAVTRTLASAPTGIVVEAIVTVSMRDAANAAAVCYVYLSALSQADVAASAANATTASGGASSTASNGTANARIRTNTSAQIRSRCDQTNAAMTLTIGTHGWVDTRGRLY